MPLLRFDDVIKQFNLTRALLSVRPWVWTPTRRRGPKKKPTLSRLGRGSKKPTPGSSEIMDLEDLFTRIEKSAGAIVGKLQESLGINNESIRQGGILTALTICRSLPKARAHLLEGMLAYFEEPNSELRLGVLEFYIEASKELNAAEMAAFYKHLKGRLGQNASNCINEEGEFVLKAAIFLGLGSFSEAKTLLLDIIRNCPSTDGNDK